MEACKVETGLLRKKPCGQPAVTHCANCEQPLCATHAVPELTAGKKTGKFLCHDCEVAQRDYKKRLEAMKKDTTSPLSRAAMKKPDTPVPEPAQAKPTPPAADKKPGGYDGGIDFTPSKDKK